MTKQNFIALADTIRAASTNSSLDRRFSQQQIELLADFCASQNPLFKRDRWLGYIAGNNVANGGTRKGGK